MWQPGRIDDGIPQGLYEGVPYAYGTTVAPGESLVFLAGACPLDPGGTVVTGGIAEQAAQCVANLELALAARGSDLGNVVRTTVYVATDRPDELVAGWDAVRAAFRGLDPPSTLVGVSILGYAGQRVEVEAIATLG